jgi:glycosyltransferase involved in cell wall biosynthesis
MKKILHLAKFYYPEKGGIESVCHSLARGAATSKLSVTVICFQKSLRMTQAEVMDDVSVIRTPARFFLASQPLSFSYIFECIKRARNVDLVHVHYPNILAALSTLFMGKKCKLLVHWHSDVINKGALGWVIQPLERMFLKRANVIIATSINYAQGSSPLRPFISKVRIVPIGVQCRKLYLASLPSPQLTIDIEAKLKGKKIILSVGRLVPYKGLDILIEASRYINDDAVTVIVGGGPLHQVLQLKINYLNLNDKVYLAGRLSDEDLHALYQRAEIFCMPSTTRAEAFGVVLLEAMTHGLPIVATNIQGSGVSWVNEHLVSGLNVPVLNPLALADACNKILSCSSLRKSLSIGAIARYKLNFTEKASIDKVLAIYSRLLGA